ncbi:MAG: peptide chain release factor N(5)-glutamine methyltransferase [Candidatus Moranbacteria bacterium]|nr:peptide chain release factor N(5)-glutamine methyltransferase [Candidatus Moranbacteria bacterium]
MTIRESLAKYAFANKISPLDAEILLSLALKKPKEYIIAHPEKKLTRLQEKKYQHFTNRRLAGEPVAYIAGRKEFFGLDFEVDKHVLIPRPETELVVERVLDKMQNAKCKIPDAIIDVGTGSGNIIIALAKNVKNKKINFYALDISKDALSVAKKNAKKNKAAKKIKFIQSYLLDYFLKQKNLSSKNIFIIANLPYVSKENYKANFKNLKFEPSSALVSGKDGLHHYKKLFGQIKNSLPSVDHCSLFIEISPEQKPEILREIKSLFPSAKPRFSKDLAGKWRIVEFKIT